MSAFRKRKEGAGLARSQEAVPSVASCLAEGRANRTCRVEGLKACQVVDPCPGALHPKVTYHPSLQDRQEHPYLEVGPFLGDLEAGLVALPLLELS